MAERTRSRLRRILVGVVLVVFTLLALDQFLPADIRPDDLSERTPDDAAARARLESLRAAHGSEAWEQYTVMDVQFEDDWPFWLTRAVLSPWDVDNQPLRGKLLRRSWITELTLLDGEDPGERWGLQSWNTWRASSNGQPIFDESWIVGTMVPGLRYFIELPLAQDTATYVQDAGTADLRGKPHERLYVTWNQSAPQRDYDQYLLWIDPDTNLVSRVDFTIRALSGLAVATADFRGYQEHGGVMLPSEIVIDGVLPTGHTLPVHIIRIDDVQWDTVSAESLMPDSKLVDTGEAKPRAP